MLKITAADKAFSQCIRQRAGWRCERCGSQPAPQGLHCSHFHGRGKWSVRFDPENAEALCYGCHRLMGSQPEAHRSRIIAKLGIYRFDALTERANNLALGRQAKRDQKAIAAHFRAQLTLMQLGNILEGFL